MKRGGWLKAVIAQPDTANLCIGRGVPSSSFMGVPRNSGLCRSCYRNLSEECAGLFLHSIPDCRCCSCISRLVEKYLHQSMNASDNAGAYAGAGP